MNLSREQTLILNGDSGPQLAGLMNWLVRWGDAMGAERLVPVRNVHLSGLSAPPVGRKPATDHDFKLALEDALLYCSQPVVCPATCANADVAFGGEDLDGGAEATRLRSFQRNLFRLAASAGVLLTWTCTPFLVGNLPMRGEVCAWTESSAIVFANSILGARTTRHGTESAVAAAATGFTPEFGVLLDKGRYGQLIIATEVPLSSSTDWGALGYFAGEKAGLRIPVFLGPTGMNQNDATQICSAVATTGGVSMFHIVGITGEARTVEEATGGKSPTSLETWHFGRKELQETYAKSRDFGCGPVDYVILGCPHSSLQEIVEVVRLLEERTVSPSVRFEVWTAHAVWKEAERLGFLDRLRHAGAQLLADSCPAVCRPTSKGIKVLTNSFKQAHYLRATMEAQVSVAAEAACVEAAVTGKWKR